MESPFDQILAAFMWRLVGTEVKHSTIGCHMKGSELKKDLTCMP